MFRGYTNKAILYFLRLSCLILLVCNVEPLKAEIVSSERVSSSKKLQTTKKDTSEKPIMQRHKKESLWRFAPLPSVAYNIERGFGYGAYITLFKKKEVPKGVRGSRYEYSINLGLFQTTKGYQNHKLVFDAPYLSRSRLRFQSILGYESQNTSWYSGVGTPAALQQPLVDNKAYLHPLRSLWFMPSLTQPLVWINKALTLSFGWIGRYAYVSLPTNSLITREKPIGSEGGLLSSVQLSLAWDSRDREPDTQGGIWTEVSMRTAQKFLRSDWSYVAANLTHRHYLKLSQSPWVIFAYRLGLDWQNGQVPFFQRGMMGGVQWTELGGNSVLRGYKFGRFRGETSAYLSTEFRARVLRFFFKNRPVDMQLCPLLDLGSIQGANDVEFVQPQLKKSQWLWGTIGIGGRTVYDEGFVVRVDITWALERYQKVSNDGVQHRAQLGIFAMTGHSF